MLIVRILIVFVLCVLTYVVFKNTLFVLDEKHKFLGIFSAILTLYLSLNFCCNLIDGSLTTSKSLLDVFVILSLSYLCSFKYLYINKHFILLDGKFVSRVNINYLKIVENALIIDFNLNTISYNKSYRLKEKFNTEKFFKISSNL